MSRQHHLGDVNYYEQRRTKNASSHEESKRRKMIRWIRSTFGLVDEAPKPPPRPSIDTSQRMSMSVRSTTASTASMSSESVADSISAKFAAVSIDPDARPHVLIIGAGLGGLCLAQGLRKQGIPFTVFERDPSPNYRSQGYRVRIDSSGYEALKEVLSPADVEVLLRASGHFLPGSSYVDASTGTRIKNTSERFDRQPNLRQSKISHHHIFSPDRALLRTVLLGDLAEQGLVRFGMAFKRFETTSSGRVRVLFECGRVVEGSLLVGADGTTSRVRRQYVPHHVTLLDTDTGAIYGKTPRTKELEALFPPDKSTVVVSEHPRMSLVVEPRGHSFNNAQGLEQEMQDYIGWVLMARSRHLYYHFEQDDDSDEPFQPKAVFALPPERVAQLALDMTRGWNPKVRALLENQAPDWCVLLRVCSMSPELDRWSPTRVTLMGDAVHTMAPAGLGCNTALYDAQRLLDAFSEHGVNVDAIASYEREMRAAGREGIALSLEACAQLHGLPRLRDMPTVR